jgi:hypothetical protein
MKIGFQRSHVPRIAGILSAPLKVSAFTLENDTRVKSSSICADGLNDGDQLAVAILNLEGILLITINYCCNAVDRVCT